MKYQQENEKKCRKREVCVNHEIASQPLSALRCRNQG